MFVSTNPAVTTFHSFDSPTVATGNNAKLSTTAFPIPGAFASTVVMHRIAPSARVIRGGGNDTPTLESYTNHRTRHHSSHSKHVSGNVLSTNIAPSNHSERLKTQLGALSFLKTNLCRRLHCRRKALPSSTIHSRNPVA